MFYVYISYVNVNFFFSSKGWFYKTLFPTGLAAFEHEGIQNITTLKDQLVSGNHEQSESIIKRHADVVARWNKLLSDSLERKNKLLVMQVCKGFIHVAYIVCIFISNLLEIMILSHPQENTKIRLYSNRNSSVKLRSSTSPLPRRPLLSTHGLKMLRRI